MPSESSLGPSVPLLTYQINHGASSLCKPFPESSLWPLFLMASFSSLPAISCSFLSPSTFLHSKNFPSLSTACFFFYGHFIFSPYFYVVNSSVYTPYPALSPQVPTSCLQQRVNWVSWRIYYSDSRFLSFDRCLLDIDSVLGTGIRMWDTFFLMVPLQYCKNKSTR